MANSTWTYSFLSATHSCVCATVLRRKEMEKEIELHELERTQTARPEDLMMYSAQGDDMDAYGQVCKDTHLLYSMLG